MSQILLAKIKDSYVFDKDSTKSHFYFIIENETGEIYLQELTHLYRPDKKRMDQLKKGILIKTYVEGFDTPQGVRKKIIKHDVFGNKITMDEIDKNLDNPDRRKKKLVTISTKQKT